MRSQQINLIGGFYADSSKAWSVQDTCNWLPEAAEVSGTLTQYKLGTAPGMREFANLGDSSIRGMHNCEGRLFVVSGTSLYQVATTGAATYLGRIPGVGRVNMSHNQITNGNELLVTNGQSGGGYVWNTVDKTFAKISDEGYPGARSCAYMDSYLLQVEPFGRYWFHSDLADATAYNTLDRYESEAQPDRIVTLAVSQFEVVVFNETTTEFFYNAGSSTGTFQSKRVLIDRGCASGDSVAKLDNTLFWLGDDGVVYRLNGYQAQPISTGPIQEAIKGKTWAQSFAFVWEEDRHKVYYLTFPDGETWGYDVVTGVWHRRESYGMSRWRLSHLIRWNNQWVGGDAFNGRLWVLDDNYLQEGEQPLVSYRRSQVQWDSQNAFRVPSVELVMDTGNVAGVDLPQVGFRYSKDRGRNWSNIRYRSIGQRGQYDKRIKLLRLGQYRQVVIEISVSDPVKRELLSAVAVIEGTP